MVTDHVNKKKRWSLSLKLHLEMSLFSEPQVMMVKQLSPNWKVPLLGTRKIGSDKSNYRGRLYCHDFTFHDLHSRPEVRQHLGCDPVSITELPILRIHNNNYEYKCMYHFGEQSPDTNKISPLQWWPC